MLNSITINIISYQVKKLKFYDDQTTSVTYVGQKNWDIQ